MNVYLNSYFGTKRNGKHPGKKIISGREFNWNGRQWKIPAVYLCEDGLAVDFCILVPGADAEKYLSRWYNKCLENKLTDEENEILEKENPFCLSFHAAAFLGEIELPGLGASSVSWHPCSTGREYIGPEAEELMESYGCSRKEGWLFVRSSFGWPDGIKPETTQEHLSSLRLTLTAHPVFYPGFHFKTEEGQTPQDLTFTHPVTMEVYTLNIISCEAGRLPGDVFSRDRGLVYPRNYLSLSYKVTPDLPPEVFRIQDCNPCDPPRGEKDASKHPLASSVSIIGGASGPVSIFIAGKNAEGSISYPACSAPRFSPVKSVEWRTSFYIRECEDMTADNIIPC